MGEEESRIEMRRQATLRLRALTEEDRMRLATIVTFEEIAEVTSVTGLHPSQVRQVLNLLGFEVL